MVDCYLLDGRMDDRVFHCNERNSEFRKGKNTMLLLIMNEWR